MFRSLRQPLFLFFGLITNLRADSFFDPNDATANSSNRLSTQQGQKPGHDLSVTVSVDDLHSGGRYHGVAPGQGPWQVMISVRLPGVHGLHLKTTSAVDYVILRFKPQLPLLSYEANVLLMGREHLGIQYIILTDLEPLDLQASIYGTVYSTNSVLVGYIH